MEEGKDLVRVTDRMRALCSRREYCSADILKKAMSALDGDRARAETVVAKLIDEKYIDDLRYSSAFARDKSSILQEGYVFSLGKGFRSNIKKLCGTREKIIAHFGNLSLVE